ncbi:hypothetical protein AHF37_05356 [Paragonimus kellicotti]|nr:hypothetical protein AHF37_05356 [Paragonimus kellicotti]
MFAGRFCRFVLTTCVPHCRFVVTLRRKYPLTSPSWMWADGIVPPLTIKQQVYEQVNAENTDSNLIEVLLTADVPATRGRFTIGEAYRLERLTDARNTQFKIVPLSVSGLAALAHFDHYYAKAYGSSAWCAMRIAMLGPPAKAAVLNRFSSDFVHSAVDGIGDWHLDLVDMLSKQPERAEQEATSSTFNSAEVAVQQFRPSFPEGTLHPNRQSTATRQFLGRAQNPIPQTTDLTEFVPVTELISESELFSRQCDHDVTFTPTQLHSDLFDSVSDEWNWPQDLRVKCTRRGWVGSHRTPTFSDGQFNFFPMDLGSIVPVLALNLQQGDSLLDLCAAPGGKSVVALQTLLPRRVVCVDNSASRLTRLRYVLATHSLTGLNGDSDQSPGLDLNVLHETQLFDFVQQKLTSEDRLFDKVLVDVPCSTDRHALTSDEGSLFSRGKSKARSSLPERQMALLQRAMRLCRPGGSVVYSTCTLSPAQNQAVIEACMAKSTGPDCDTHFALVDLSPLFNAFARCYNNLGLHILPVLSSNLPPLLIGLLVVPLLSANYGPTFVAKLRRIR